MFRRPARRLDLEAHGKRPVLESCAGRLVDGIHARRLAGDSGATFTVSSPLLAQAASDVLSVDDVLSPYIFVFYVAFIVTFIMTPLMRVVARHYWIVDEPDLVRPPA